MAALAALLWHAPLQAQVRVLTVTAVQNLRFGTVLPGVSDHMLRTDATGAGRLDLRGTNNAQVQMVFTLPTTMAGPAGATMPISFGSTDAGFSPSRSIASQTVFDPRAAALGRLSGTGRAAIFLGGTANPGPSQRSGAYTGTITLTASYTGL